MTDFNELTKEQQNALLKADKSFKTADTLSNFGNGIFFISIVIPAIMLIQATSDGDDNQMTIALGWLLASAISAGLLRALTLVIANISDMKGHELRLIVSEQSGWTKGG